MRHMIRSMDIIVVIGSSSLATRESNHHHQKALGLLTMSMTAALKYDVETCLAASFARPSAHFAHRRTSSNVTVGDQGGLARENSVR